MGHDWLFEVLMDMKTYAVRHGFDELAAKLDETEQVARREVDNSDGSTSSGSEAPIRRR